MKICNKCSGLIENNNSLPICLKCWDNFVNGSQIRSSTFTGNIKNKLSPDYSKVATEILQKYEM